MRLALCSLLVAVSVGCGGGNPLRESALAIASAAITARSVSLATSAIGGAPASCVSVTAACTTYPCQGGVAIALGDGCALPLGGAATGTINVTGNWTSATQATLSATLADVRAGAESKAVALASVTSVSASVSGDIVSVTYVGSTAVARSGVSSTAAGGSSSWTISVDTQGTAEADDDVLTIDSTQASGSAGLGASAKVADFNGVVLDPTCRDNPTAGQGNITSVSGFIPKITKISFHSACDGKGEVNGSAHDFDYLP